MSYELIGLDRRNRLVDEVTAVLEDSVVPHTNEGVTSFIDLWYSKKKKLIKLLQRHPGWSDEVLGVILPTFDLSPMADKLLDRVIDDLEDDYKNHHTAIVGLLRLLKGCGRYLDEETVTKLRSYIDEHSLNVSKRITRGDKTSRLIKKFLEHYKLVSSASGYRTYTLSRYLVEDLMNTLNEDGSSSQAILSVNPIDYLLSANGAGWTSCHRLGGREYSVGERASGSIAYATSASAMVFYSVKSERDEPICRRPKETRQMFFYGNKCFFQSHLYPFREYSGEFIVERYREYVQSIFSECLRLNCGWHTIDTAFRQHIKEPKYPLYYGDWRISTAYYSYPENWSPRDISLNSKVLCLYCAQKNKTTRPCCCQQVDRCDRCEKRDFSVVRRSGLGRYSGSFYCDDCYAKMLSK